MARHEQYHITIAHVSINDVRLLPTRDAPDGVPRPIRVIELAKCR
jgi:hypothetical protein